MRWATVEAVQRAGGSRFAQTKARQNVQVSTSRRSRPLESSSPWSSTACVTATSVAWPKRPCEVPGRNQPATALPATGSPLPMP